MRKTLYEHLTANSTIPRWFQPYVATKDTEKPYGVIQLGEDLPSMNTSRGFFRDCYFWLYAEPGSFLALDEAALELKKMLAGRVLTTSTGTFEMLFVRIGRDFYDQELEAAAKRVEFRIPITL